MANGDTHGIPWQWMAGLLATIVMAGTGLWARLVSGKVAGHSETLAKLEEFCRAQRETNKEITTNFREIHTKLNDLISRRNP